MIKIPKVYTTLSNGVKIEYPVVMTFTKDNINYVIYTDNTYDKYNKIKFYVAKYNPLLEIPFLGEPTTKEEWTEITKIINKTLPPK